MGYMKTEKVSRLFNRMLHRGPTSIEECVAECVRTGTTVGTAMGEGDLDLALALVVGFLDGREAIEPEKVTPRLKALLKSWRDGEDDMWTKAQYRAFDRIKWRPLKKRLPVSHYWDL